ncbi:MAG: hypothetical protein AAF480_06555 [Actinomycetota bacterium]
MTDRLRRHRKALVKLALLGVLASAVIAFVSLASRALNDLTTSDETEEIFNAAALLPPDLVEAVQWLPDNPDSPREMEPLTRDDITDAWLRAWEQLSIVARTGDTSGLEVYFSNSALEALQANADQTRGLPVRQIGHTLQVEFYSHDGQVLSVTAPEVKLLRAAPVGDVQGWRDATESYEAIMILEDGNWRVHHWLRTGAQGRWWSDPVTPATAAPAQYRGVNYFPADTPYEFFWPGFDPAVVDGDLARVAALGLDTVRVPIPFEYFFGRWTIADDLEPVVAFLDLAQAHGLGVIATLFDGRNDHSTSRWDADVAHVTTVVATLARHPALVMWDIKDGPDRDVGIRGTTTQEVHAWVGHIAHAVRAVDGDTPITIGWSSAAAAAAAPPVGDVVSFAHAGTAEELASLLPLLRATAGDRPLQLARFGISSWDGIFPGGHTEAEQAAHHADILQLVDAEGLGGALGAALWDLALPPPDAGPLPWQVGHPTNMGILRADGTAKPVAAVIAPGADLDAVPRPGPLARLDRLFWRIALLAVVVGAIVFIATRRIQERTADADAGGDPHPPLGGAAEARNG